MDFFREESPVRPGLILALHITQEEVTTVVALLLPFPIFEVPSTHFSSLVDKRLALYDR